MTPLKSAKGITAPAAPGALCDIRYPARWCEACARLAKIAHAALTLGTLDAAYARELRRAAVQGHQDTPAPAGNDDSAGLE